MALCEYLFPPVLQSLLPCCFWQEDRQKWRLHQVSINLKNSSYHICYVQCIKLFHLYYLCRKYLPLLKKFPAQYIYEPWKAPRSIQQAAGCIVGKDYPRPIVEHEVISKKNIQRMKLAYAKRPKSTAESPSKKQGIEINILL